MLSRILIRIMIPRMPGPSLLITLFSGVNRIRDRLFGMSGFNYF
jgi:hypothetical protein